MYEVGLENVLKKFYLLFTLETQFVGLGPEVVKT